MIAAAAMRLAIEVRSRWNCARVRSGPLTLGLVWKRKRSTTPCLEHGQYIHAEEISTVNMSTSNSFSRLVPNRPSHLS